jgi:hypothetical protein
MKIQLLEALPAFQTMACSAASSISERAALAAKQAAEIAVTWMLQANMFDLAKTAKEAKEARKRERVIEEAARVVKAKAIVEGVGAVALMAQKTANMSPTTAAAAMRAAAMPTAVAAATAATSEEVASNTANPAACASPSALTRAAVAQGITLASHPASSLHSDALTAAFAGAKREKSSTTTINIATATVDLNDIGREDMELKEVPRAAATDSPSAAEIVPTSSLAAITSSPSVLGLNVGLDFKTSNATSLASAALVRAQSWLAATNGACSLTHLLIHPLTHLLIHPLTHPLTYPLIHPLTHPLIHPCLSLTLSPTLSPTYSQVPQRRPQRRRMQRQRLVSRRN